MLYFLTDNELNISVESFIILIMGPKLYIYHSIGEGTSFDSYRQMFLIFSTNADSSSNRLVSLFLPANSAYGSRSQCTCTTESETSLVF